MKVKDIKNLFHSFKKIKIIDTLKAEKTLFDNWDLNKIEDDEILKRDITAIYDGVNFITVFVK